MSQSDWTVNSPVVKHMLSSYLVPLLAEFTASPKFKPRHGGSEQDGAGSCFCLAVQFSAEACQLLVAYDNLCIHSPILYIQARCLFLQTSAPAFFGSQTTSRENHRPPGPPETKSSLSGRNEYRGPGQRYLLVGPGFFTHGSSSWRSTRRAGSLSRPGPDLVPEASRSPSSCLRRHLLSSCHYERGLYFYLCSSHLWLQLVAHLCVSWGPLVRLLTSQHRHNQISVPNSFGLRWPEKFRLFSSDC